MSSTIVAHLRSTIDRSPERCAVVCATRRLTFGELGAELDAKVGHFRRLGIGAGSRVGVVAAPAVAHLSDLYGLLDLGALVVPLPAGLSGWELARIADQACLTHLVVDEARTVQQLPAEPELRFGPAIGQLTSGTTGTPKVAVRTEAALLAEVAAYGEVLGLDPDRDRFLCMLSLHHAYGSGLCALAALLHGVPVECTAPLPRPVAEVLGTGRITRFPVVPTMLRLVLAGLDGATVLSDVHVLSAGELLDQRTAAAAIAAFGPTISQVYGTSETGVLCMGERADAASVAASVGRPVRGVEVRIDSGRVLVRGPSMLEGYLDGDRITLVDGGWLRTGDLGTVGPDGEVRLTGRSSCAINVGGVKVSPEEVEAALLEFPGVTGALVSGVVDDSGFVRVRATVTPAGVDLGGLRAFGRARLSGPRRPQTYEATDALARTASGKLVRRPLEAPARSST